MREKQSLVVKHAIWNVVVIRFTHFDCYTCEFIENTFKKYESLGQGLNTNKMSS